MKINKNILQFLINGAVLFALWSLFYAVFRHMSFVHTFYEYVTESFTQFLLEASRLVLNTSGNEAYIVSKAIYIADAERAVYLDRGCLGRNLMGLFAGLLIAFPGNWKHKLWYIPMGISIIIIINIIRISALTFVWKCCPAYGEINHDYIFKYTVYILTFVLWYYWIKNFLPQNKKKINA